MFVWNSLLRYQILTERELFIIRYNMIKSSLGTAVVAVSFAKEENLRDQETKEIRGLYGATIFYGEHFTFHGIAQCCL